MARDLSVRIGTLELPNPLISASGCFGYGLEYEDVTDLSALGGVCVKGLFLTEREGHAPPRIVETPAGMINAIGLQGIGVHRFVKEKLPLLRERGARVFVNVCGTTIDEYAEVTRILTDAGGVAAIELNISCPNIKESSNGHCYPSNITPYCISVNKALTYAQLNRGATPSLVCLNI